MPESKNRRRVLHCIWTLGSGGAERQLSYLAPEIARLGWDVHVAFAFGGRYRQRLADSPVTLHDLGACSRKDFRVAWRLRKLVTSLRPAVIQTWLTQMDLIGGLAALSSRTRWILSERSSAAAYPPSVLHTARKFLGRRAALVVANSAGGLDYWRSVRHARDVVIPNGLPLDSIDEAESRPLPGSARGALLFVGRLGVEKNPAAFLSALSFPAIESVKAIVCGAGPLMPDLERQCRVNELGERVFFAGEVDEIWPVMKNAGALVAPSLFEGNPNAVIEAAACGLPLVVSDIPAHREILRQGSAVFVDPTSPRSIAQGIADAMGPDAPQRVRSAREDVAGLDIRSTASSYDAVYRSLCQGEE